VKAERDARKAREKQIDAMKPEDPYELRDKVGYQPSERCGQGPYRFESTALEAKYGERLIVYACGKHAINGNYRISRTQKYGKAEPFERSFGYGSDNAACKGKEIAVVTDGAASGGGGGAKGGTGKTGGPTAAAPAKVEPVKVTKTTAIATDCVKTEVINYGSSSDGAYAAFDGSFTIDVWSKEPNDLEDIVFVVERHAVIAGMTLEKWKAYRTAYDAWADAYRAFADGELEAGRWMTVDDSVKTPPPPTPRAETPTPRPSKNARWIPGYWLYDAAKFHWIAGLWDVPEEDVKKELTVQAPTPPPAQPTRDDVPTEAAPTATAVWTPGSWQWDGRGYVWIAGAWRIPPGAQHSWQRPTWTVRTGRAIYVPGGWRIRIGR